jgi:hypothetical protein
MRNGQGLDGKDFGRHPESKPTQRGRDYHFVVPKGLAQQRFYTLE